MTKPVVSVCVPTYNGERYLRECFESILLQTRRDFEVLVVDDGSTDGTMDICAEFARRDSRFRIERNPRNLGLVGNWNRCVALSQAEWIKFVFQDDTLHPHGLSALLNVATSVGAPLAFGRRGFLFEDGTSPESTALYEGDASHIAEMFLNDGGTNAREFSKLVMGNLTRNIVGEPVAVLLRRDVFDAVGTFHPDVAVFCDMEFWARVGTRFGVAHTSETVADFRVHGASTTARTTSGDSFRMTALDHVVVQHDMAFAPAYAALRQVAADEGIDMTERFAATAIWARGQALRLAQDPYGAQLKPLADLERLQARLPRLHEVLAPAKRRHELGQFVGRVKRVLSGKAPESPR